MSRTITALFDERADAEAGRQRLFDAHLDADNVKIHDKSSIGETGYSSPSQPGMWASIKNAFLPDEDRHIYEEGVRRGGFLLTADVDDDQVDAAVRALEEGHGSGIDIDERANQWKSQGWQPPVVAAGMAGGAAAVAAGEGQPLVKGNDADETRIPVVEEQLVVGKREVDRGGVRVRSYVSETPVHEQIRLREERINVERHPVDRAVGNEAFREQAIEMHATAEEAVVQKTARSTG
jgi:stress response protein YsnF